MFTIGLVLMVITGFVWIVVISRYYFLYDDLFWEGGCIPAAIGTSAAMLAWFVMIPVMLLICLALYIGYLLSKVKVEVKSNDTKSTT